MRRRPDSVQIFDFAAAWAIRRRGATPSVARAFSSWYGSNESNADSLAEGWALFEMNFWRLEQD